jgi:hypothetical protein
VSSNRKRILKITCVKLLDLKEVEEKVDHKDNEQVV